jgi:hypothetical protein
VIHRDNKAPENKILKKEQEFDPYKASRGEESDS